MKKAFTLLELLIVVIIIGIIIGAVGNIFSYKKIDRVNFDTCYINIYGKVDKFFQEALSQRGIYTGGKYENPTYYDLVFDKSNQEIKFVYSGVLTKVIKLVGQGQDDVNKCYAPTYHTFLSGNISLVKIKPGLQVDTSITSQSPMQLYSGNTLLPAYQTGVVYFYFCDHPSNSNCLQKYKLEVDPRTYLFKSYFCLQLGTDGLCKKWSE